MLKILDYLISSLIVLGLFLGIVNVWAKEDAAQNPPPVTYESASISQSAASRPDIQSIPGVDGFRYRQPEASHAYTAEELAVWVPMGEFKVTAYCPCSICCGVWAYNRPNGIVYTASGEIAIEGVSVGSDWDVIPAGSRILIEGVGEYTVHDNGSAKGKVIDVYHTTHEKALSFTGAGKRQVYVWQEGNP